MGETTIYYAEEAQIADRLVYDGKYLYESLSSLTGLNGKKGRFKKLFRKIGKGLRKVGKLTYKIVKKLVPIANTVASFIPVIGWAAKVGLTAAQIAININEKRKKRRSNQLRPMSNQLRKRNAATVFFDRNDIQKNQMYDKTGNNNIRPNKKIHISPELLHEQALTYTQSYYDDAQRLINTEMRNKTTANKVKTMVKEQLKVQERNIFNDVAQLFII